MTREEAKNWLHKLYARADITDEYGDMEDMQPYEEAIHMAISALSADVDCISRQAVINAIANTCFWLSADNWNELIKCINSISSVENKGEWIKDEKMSIVFDIYRCSRCSADGEPRYKFCPNCGAKMKGVSE